MKLVTPSMKAGKVVRHTKKAVLHRARNFLELSWQHCLQSIVIRIQTKKLG